MKVRKILYLITKQNVYGKKLKDDGTYATPMNELSQTLRNDFGITGQCISTTDQIPSDLCTMVLDGDSCQNMKIDTARVCRWTDNDLFDETMPYVIQVSGSNSPGDGLVDLCMQVSGGSTAGNVVTISSGFGWNKTKANGTFFIKQAGISDDGEPYYVIQVSGSNSPGDGQADLCIKTPFRDPFFLLPYVVQF